MTGTKLLLDTNVAIDYFKGKSHVVSVIQQQEALYIPVVVLGELYVGAHRSDDVVKKMTEIEELLAHVVLLNLDKSVAGKYALIKKELFEKGRPIPENDIWIAAFALLHELSLYTFDKHFKEIDGLQLFNPLSPI